MSRPNHTTPAPALLCAVCLLLLLATGTAVANVEITIYGSGGISFWPSPSICPVRDPDKVCFHLVIDGTQGSGTDPQGQAYNVVLNTAIPSGVTEMDGADLDIQSITPIP